MNAVIKFPNKGITKSNGENEEFISQDMKNHLRSTTLDHPPAWVFAAAKLFLVGISNKVSNKLKKKTKEG